MSLVKPSFDNVSVHHSVAHEGWVHWRGRWKSSVVPMVFGTISVPLKPFGIMRFTPNYTFDTTAYVRYKGAYRYGSEVKLPVKVTMSEAKEGVSTQGSTSQTVVMSMKLAITVSQQSIEYTTTIFTDREISGVYTARMPDDFGTFQIMPTGDPLPQDTEPCTIL